MKVGLALGPGDRAFLELVARAVTTNPFTPERTALDAEIAAAGGTGGASGEAFAAIAGRRLARHAGEGRGGLHSCAAADREALGFALLFDLFYRLAPRVDAAIEEQLAAGDAPCPAPFAGEALAELEGHGFERDAALRHLAVMFQMRRAWRFIDRELVGASPCMVALRADLWNDVFTHDLRLYAAHLWERMEDFSTLLLGETGTGKGAAAAAIGRSGFIPFDPQSGRFAESFARAFVPVHLAGIPEPLIESALFGHEKGAFTGAVARHEGVFAACSRHGAVFLDEIGEVSGPVQVKLLRVLQERRFSPVGGRREASFRGRVIAATHRDVGELRAAGALREDLYYRLCSDQVVVPPLRQRLCEDPGELERLVRLVLRRTLGGEASELVERVCAAIDEQLGPGYDWPGNVRELEQCVRSVLLKGRCSAQPRSAGRDDPLAARLLEGTLDARELLARYCAHLFERLGSLEAVARVAGLDRRTVRRHVERARELG